MTLDFTLEQYKLLCQVIVESQYKILSINEYINNPIYPKNIILIRHDVDRCPKNALRMAELENRFNIRSTYYFRHTRNVFKLAIIQQISRLGHDIGYHYETLSKARGNYEEALRLFNLELRDFRKIVNVQTICMHGSPLSRFDNRNLWKKFNYHEFNLTGEVYLSINYKKIHYFTDTGRTWQRTKFNLRDYSQEMKQDDLIRSTKDLITAIHQEKFPQICISAHPERWANNMTTWILSIGFDYLANFIKAGFHLINRFSSN